jgi:hypothetical protein
MKKEADAVSRSLEETTATNQSPAVDSHDVSLARSLHAAYKGVGWGGTAERIAADKPVSSEARTEPARSANPCPRCEVLKKALEDVDKVLQVEAAEYVPAIRDAFTIIDRALKQLEEGE